MWTNSDSENLNSIQIYCDGFAINFINLLMIIFSFLSLKVIMFLILRKWPNTFIDYIYQKLSNLFSRSFVLWWIPNILFIFPCSFIFLDIMQTKNHTLNSIISIFVLLFTSAYIIFTRFEILSIVNISTNKEEVNWAYSYLLILRNISVIWLFWLETQNGYIIWKVIFYTFQLWIWVYTTILLSRITI